MHQCFPEIQWVPEGKVTFFTSDGLIQIGGSMVPRRVTSSDVCLLFNGTCNLAFIFNIWFCLFSFSFFWGIYLCNLTCSQFLWYIRFLNLYFVLLKGMTRNVYICSLFFISNLNIKTKIYLTEAREIKDGTEISTFSRE